ncbi:hypothetical protein QN397_19605 [Variovorax sp. RTB1]|uniref:TA system antitoxin ParD family protein n=1 Tax=Variovorax sp. RTB1 TaxID=3048631 RepID=UPI002B23A50D|nr:hypothetical protein [Variovorax sp. RTB1]MEB0113517.1 hypothetical protein [Variovorax sp. RTB1]
MSSSSNSIRVAALLFSEAQAQGALMSRSASQQNEHWVRLELALEEAGLTVAEATRMLQADRSPQALVREVPEHEIWDFKRARQKRDLENVRSGRLTGQSLSWFTPEQAKAAKLVDSPY